MKKLVALLIAFIAVGVFVVLGSAESVTVGNVKLSGSKSIEWADNTITVLGKASFTSTSSASLKAGQMVIDSLKSETIKVELARGKDKNYHPKSAVATGGVTIDGRRANVDKDESGKSTLIHQTIHAVAETAKLSPNENVAVLSGNVIVKIYEPGVPDPVYYAKCDRFTFSLKDNAMSAESLSDKPVDIVLTQKEREKSQTSQK